MDADDVFRLQLWHDAQGFFGELSSPVLDADSPTSRLYDVNWNPTLRRLEFVARPGGGTVRIVGVLSKLKFRLSQATPWSEEGLVLRRRDEPLTEWKSRAQFECAMTLFRRW